MKLALKFLLYAVSVLTASAEDFYCSDTSQEVVIEGKTEGQIITRREGQNYYSDNVDCAWIVRAEPNERIHLTVESSDLEWNPPNSLCGSYDHVEISDKNGSLVSWCGKEFPKKINSKGNWLKVIFHTDDTNPRGYVFRGAKIKFTMFDNSSCPPEWLSFNDSCYAVSASKHNWDSSQKECNRMQSNLLAVKSQAEWNFLTSGLLTSSQGDFLWTGLNDIKKNAHLMWIDNTTVTGLEGFNLPKVDKYKHCGAVHAGNQQVYMQLCDRKTLFAVCKANKNRSTKLFSVPVPSKNKASNDDDGVARILKIVVLPIAVVVLVVLICAIVCRQRIRTSCERRKAQRRGRNAQQDPEEIGQLRETPSAPDWDKTGRTTPPPSYDDLHKYS